MPDHPLKPATRQAPALDLKELQERASHPVLALKHSALEWERWLAKNRTDNPTQAVAKLENLNLSNREFHYYDFTNCHFINCNFEGATFYETKFSNDTALTNCNFKKATFNKSKLERVDFANCNLDNSQWDKCIVEDCNINESITGLKMSGCDWHGGTAILTLTNSELASHNFQNLVASSFNFKDCILQSTDFIRSEINQFQSLSSSITECDLSYMTGESPYFQQTTIDKLLINDCAFEGDLIFISCPASTLQLIKNTIGGDVLLDGCVARDITFTNNALTKDFKFKDTVLSHSPRNDNLIHDSSFKNIEISAPNKWSVNNKLERNRIEGLAITSAKCFGNITISSDMLIDRLAIAHLNCGGKIDLSAGRITRLCLKSISGLKTNEKADFNLYCMAGPETITVSDCNFIKPLTISS